MSRSRNKDSIYQVAGNGLLHRRALLGRGLAIAGALGTGAMDSEKAPNNDPGANQVQRVDFLVISYPYQGSRSEPIVTPSGCSFAQRNHRLGDFL
jgi:hypothetical protein